MLQNLLNGLSAILTLQNGLFMVLGTIIGILAGAIPGLSSTLAISLLVPITCVMDPLPALAQEDLYAVLTEDAGLYVNADDSIAPRQTLKKGQSVQIVAGSSWRFSAS